MPADMSDDSETADHRQRAPGPRPLSRRASRLLVIGAFLLVLLLSAAGAWYILQTAEPSPPPAGAPPADTTRVDTAASADL